MSSFIYSQGHLCLPWPQSSCFHTSLSQTAQIPGWLWFLVQHYTCHRPQQALPGTGGSVLRPSPWLLKVSHPNLGVNHITVHSPWEIIQDCSPNNHCGDNYAPLLGLAYSICMGIFHYDVDTANHLESTQTSSPSLGELALDNIKLADLELFEGLGKLSEPFSITLNPDVKPIQVPPNRYAAPKLPIIKGALDKLIQTGQLVRVNEPTAWISNMVVRERPASATSYWGEHSTKRRFSLCLISGTRFKPMS